MRPGRLERAIEIGRPDAAGVANILRFHLKNDLYGADLTEISSMLEGATSAELMETVRAVRRAARYAQRELTVDDPRLRRVVEAHLRELELRAEALVVQHRGAIVAVAEELARSRHLTGDAVRAIVARLCPTATAVRRPPRRQVH